jgi:hypothetical protein
MTLSVVSNSNINLSEPEKELLRWHYRLGHLSFWKIQFLLRSGVLSHSAATHRLHATARQIAPPPKCAACMYGKHIVALLPARLRPSCKTELEP